MLQQFCCEDATLPFRLLRRWQTSCILSPPTASESQIKMVVSMSPVEPGMILGRVVFGRVDIGRVRSMAEWFDMAPDMADLDMFLEDCCMPEVR